MCASECETSLYKRCPSYNKCHTKRRIEEEKLQGATNALKGKFARFVGLEELGALMPRGGSESCQFQCSCLSRIALLEGARFNQNCKGIVCERLLFGAFELWIYLVRCCHGAVYWQQSKHMLSSFRKTSQSSLKGVSTAKSFGSFG